MILKYIFLLVLIPGILGKLITIKNQEKGCNYSYLAGILLMFSVFQVVALPCIFFDTSLNCVIGVWSAILLMIMLYLGRKYGKTAWDSLKRFNWKEEVRKIDVWGIIVFILVVIQAFMLAKYAHYDADDAYYVGMAVTSWDTNSLMRYDCYTGELLEGMLSRYVLSPFPIFIAAVSKIIGCHSAIVAHTLIPAIFIPMAYLVYALIGKILFANNKVKNEIFLILISIMGIFCYWSIYNQQIFLLYRVWQGKAILSGVLLPMIFYMALKYWNQKYTVSDWCVLICLMLSTCLVSSMGIILGAVMLGIFAIMILIKKRNLAEAMKILACAGPNVFLAVVYLFIR